MPVTLQIPSLSKTVRTTGPGSVWAVCYQKAAERTTQLFDTIQKNKWTLSSSPPTTKQNSSDKLAIASQRAIAPCYNIFIVSQSRRMDQCKYKGRLLKLYYCNMLKPGASETFSRVQPYVINQLKNVERMDVVWDKAREESKRGKGICRGVRPDTRIPEYWTAVLWVDDKRQKLFLYLAEQLTTIETDHGSSWRGSIY